MYQCLTPTGAFEIDITIDNDYLFEYKHYGGPSTYYTLLFITLMQMIK